VPPIRNVRRVDQSSRRSLRNGTDCHVSLSRYSFAMNPKKLIVLGAVLCALPALQAQQAATVPVTIVVTDPSPNGGVGIPHAQIRIVPSFDLPPAKQTDDKGRVTVHLQPRDYALVVESLGFKPSVSHFHVMESEPRTVSVVLQVGRGGGVEVIPGGGLEVETAPSKYSLTLATDLYGVSATLSSAELRAMEHVNVTVHNPHTKGDESYSGVRLADLLARMGAPLGSDFHGGAVATYIVATGSDGYKAVLALGEADPGFHPGEVIVADTVDGKTLDVHNGPLKLIVTEDKRPARSVRNLISIELKSAR